MLTGAMGPDLAKYRMHIFKPGHPTPLSWRRRDIYASDDATVKSEDEALYRTTHLRGLWRTSTFARALEERLRVREKGPH